MTKQHLLFLAFLFSLTIAKCQTFNEKYFIETEWFSNNKDSAFYLLDTLKFIKYSNYAPEWAAKEHAEYEMKFLNHGDFVELGLKKYGKMNFSWRFKNYKHVIPGGQWSWKFESKTNQLKIYDDKKVIVGIFLPVLESEVKIESRFAEQKGFMTTTNLILLRVVDQLPIISE